MTSRGNGFGSRKEMPPLDAANDPFKFRVAMQQFAIDNEELFSALARRIDTADELIEAGDLERSVDMANRLACLIAIKVTGDQNPGSNQIKAFRPTAAACVKDAVGKDIDLNNVAETIARAVGLVNASLDGVSGIDWNKIQTETSVAMTAGTLSGQLVEAVMEYDFRHDKAQLLARLAEAVGTAATKAANQALPPDASPYDKASLIQSWSRSLGKIMAKTYQRVAAQVVEHTLTIPEAERARFFEEFDPVSDLIKRFQDWATLYSSTAAAYGRAITSAQKPDHNPRP